MIVRDEYPGSHWNLRGTILSDLLVACAMLVLALILTLPAASTHASERTPLALTGPADVRTLSSHFEYTIDPDWQLNVNDFVGASALDMQPVTGPVPDFGHTTAKIWLRIRVANETSKEHDWRLALSVGYTQQIAIYKVSTDGKIETLIDLKEDSPFNARPINHPKIVVPFDLVPGETATLIVSYYTEGASRHAISVATPSSLMQDASVNTAKGFAFYGMMLVMIALATVAFMALRQFVFAAYASYFLSIFLYIAYVDGVAFQFIWPSYPQFNSVAALVTGSGVIVFGALFAISYLQTARYHPIMHRALVGVIVLVLVLDVVLWATDRQLLNKLLVYLILIGVLTCLTTGLVAARTRFREVRFYVLAWMANLVPAIFFTAWVILGVTQTVITPYDLIRLTLTIDALMMGVAIFDRYNHLRQLAAEETLSYAQRTLALTQRLAALEVSYEQATTSARQHQENVKDTVHDLRQPMHALRLSLRQLASGKLKNATDVGQIEAALGYMERLVVERLADQPEVPEKASAAQEDQSKTASENKNASEPGLHGVLRGVADMFASEASNKGLELKLVLAAPDAEVAAYPLMRILANLVSNAIKYTREGRVLIALRRHGSGHRIEVHDTGPGLSGAAFQLALQRNQRLERDRDVAEGSGLGLAVAKETVDANNWLLTSCEGRRTGASIRVHIAAG
ncbi:MAG: sensor histidine kinase [Rhizobiaceae bacterium]